MVQPGSETEMGGSASLFDDSLLIERSKSSSSKPYAETLSVKDIPSNRLLFRLVPSVRRTGETEFGLLPTVQTQGLKRCNAEGKTEFMPLDLLPTPRSADACRGGVPLTDGKNVRKSGMVFSAMLSDMAKNGLLPTPKAQEANGNASRDRGKFNLTDEIAKRFKPSGETSQLNPLFVEEMMGFPLDWLVSPFRHGGAKQ